MDTVSLVRSAWGWCGLAPARVVGENAFGNLLIEDLQGRFWRLCPEDLSCEPVAEDSTRLAALRRDAEFDEDWQMLALVALAHDSIGPLGPGQAYCLKIPGTLGGEYGAENLGRIDLSELIAASGHIARQIAGLPDGTAVQFRFID